MDGGPVDGGPIGLRREDDSNLYAREIRGGYLDRGGATERLLSIAAV